MFWTEGTVKIKALSQDKLACSRNRSNQCLMTKWVHCGCKMRLEVTGAGSCRIW